MSPLVRPGRVIFLGDLGLKWVPQMALEWILNRSWLKGGKQKKNGYFRGKIHFFSIFQGQSISILFPFYFHSPGSRLVKIHFFHSPFSRLVKQSMFFQYSILRLQGQSESISFSFFPFSVFKASQNPAGPLCPPFSQSTVLFMPQCIKLSIDNTYMHTYMHACIHTYIMTNSCMMVIRSEKTSSAKSPVSQSLAKWISGRETHSIAK